MLSLTVEPTIEEQALETETPETFRIHASRIPFIKERFAKIAGRAKRIGCAPPTFEIIDTVDVKDDETGRIDRFHTVRLIGERPIIAGYRFLGVLDHNSEIGLIVRTVPGQSIPIQYRTADPTNCDHCHKRIATRKETFIVQHVESGETKQVGRQCVADFLGGVDPKHVLAIAEWLIEAAEFLGASDDEEGGYGRGERVAELFDTVHVLALTSALYRNIGWTPRSKQTDFGPTATANLAANWFLARDKKKLFTSERTGLVDYKEMAKYEVTDKDREIADSAIEWARELGADGTELNDYQYNLTTIAKTGALEVKHFGLACSMVSAYYREIGQRTQTNSTGAALAHIGEPKKRGEFTLTVTRYSTKENPFGVTHIFSFEDQTGNRAVWFGSTDPGFETGFTYLVKATVKSHGEYLSQPQTVLARVVKIKDVHEAA